MEHSAFMLVLAFVAAILCCVYSEDLAHASALNTLEEHEESHQTQKRSPPSNSALFTDDREADANLEEPIDDAEKRQFRYGKRQFRYGKRAGTLLRFGKRGTLFRFGKRGGALFRFGRSGGSDLSEEDRLFRSVKSPEVEELLREAVARDELSNNYPWYLENDQVKRGDDGFHWGQESDQ